jgi:oligopeptide/dipeptide ABC transporter ATP-binding protein
LLNAVLAKDANALIQVKNLKKYFPVTKGIIRDKVVTWVKALDNVDLTLASRDVVGLVGESGSGKSTLTKVLLLLERPTSGEVLFEGKDVFGFKGNDLKSYRHQVQAVFQDPFSSLSPRLRLKNIIAEPLMVDHKLSKQEVEDKTARALSLVGLDPSMMNLFPHELSGGQRQRTAIARAIATEARVIILDEPTSALDVSVRLQIVDLLRRLQRELGLSYLLVGHDLAMVAYLSSSIAVMYLGQIVEFATTKELLQNTLHPYTRALISAALPVRSRYKKERIMISGEIANPFNIPPGCRFHPRCSQRKAICSESEPVLKDAGEGHRVACHF